MRIVIASDTHEQHAGIVVPDGDVFVHCGDLTYRGDPKAIGAVGTWVRSLPHAHKLVIAGNHDLLFENGLVMARHALGDGHDGLVYLQDSGITIEGVRFWGSPWQPWFYDWAFNLQRGPDIAAKWALIPDSTDVLITHGPPLGILDLAPIGGHVGCGDLLDRIAIVRPKVHVFGHIHEGSGVEQRDGTTFVNASICDGQYRPLNPVRVVDV